MSNIFDGFEAVSDLPADAVVLAYGVNVIRIDAEVHAPRTETVGGLIEQYRSKLSLPSDCVVFIDGVKVGNGAAIPVGACRIEVIKPAGEKGCENSTPIIPLDGEDACTIEVYARTAVRIVRNWVEEVGRMAASLLPVVTLPETAIVNRDGEEVIVSLAQTEAIVNRSVLCQVASIRRRLPYTLSEAWASWPAIESLLNDEQMDEGCQLEAGDRLTIVVAGGEEQVDFEVWASQMHAQANSAYDLAMAAEYEVYARRQAELEGTSFLALRSIAKAAGIAAVGAGRTRAVLTEAVLTAEFATGDRQAWVAGWLQSHAPEAAGWTPAPEEGDDNYWDGEKDEESDSAAPSNGNSRW